MAKYWFVITCFLGLTATGFGAAVTPEEARLAAENWITMVLAVEGSWGGSATATITKFQEFTRAGRQLGYFCGVEPQGYLVLSLLKELGPVKAWAANDNLDPDLEEGLTDLIKDGMERMLNSLELRLGPATTAKSSALSALLDQTYYELWEELLYPQSEFKARLASGESKANYTEGQVLLTSAWHQNPPYNDQCPSMGCSNSNGRAIVGCVATAGAQILRYWNWPLTGSGGTMWSDTYDWINMRDTVGTGSPAAQISAVAELCHEVGVAVDMDYGCSASSAGTADMEGVYENNFRYSTSCRVDDRDDFSQAEWFSLLIENFTANRPVQYRIPGHSIVADGYDYVYPGPARYYHVNYGWGGSNNAWFLVDALPGGDPSEEFAVQRIVPNVALGGTLSGSYPRNSFNFRYIDRDAVGSSAEFSGGQYYQFLPGTVMRGSGTTTYVKIYGSSTYNTRLYTRGDVNTGIRMDGGCIALSNGGGIVFR